ncbi:hypothetical protein BKA69DRAFT_1091628 [Paraphysoderma sedebokerense]|nr:hypothetical protein BKA69DRAFT_1091628 [Paraphysoderma sedebokerense]
MKANFHIILSLMSMVLLSNVPSTNSQAFLERLNLCSLGLEVSASLFPGLRNNVDFPIMQAASKSLSMCTPNGFGRLLDDLRGQPSPGPQPLPAVPNPIVPNPQQPAGPGSKAPAPNVPNPNPSAPGAQQPAPKNSTAPPRLPVPGKQSAQNIERRRLRRRSSSILTETQAADLNAFMEFTIKNYFANSLETIERNSQSVQIQKLAGTLREQFQDKKK